MGIIYFQFTIVRVRSLRILRNTINKTYKAMQFVRRKCVCWSSSIKIRLRDLITIWRSIITLISAIIFFWRAVKPLGFGFNFFCLSY
uniref:Uncharacterized protein n=1 Tax=Chlorella vulgaris TaxID=3077 RepID=V9H193_CHLVU|nr:hypothetical protein ChvulCp005 [Chlorella vulgaris]pir/T07193/ hypothetical protein 86-a - Chlorella vulgaris chloroplast [Chlorella vulgaris]BAA57840.1 unnamed protein product [Chlorella vulgaris]